MNDSTNEKILQQVVDILRVATMNPYEAMTFALQILGWAKLSYAEELQDDLLIQEGGIADHKRITKTWGELAKRSATLKAAYASSNISSILPPSALGAAVDLCTQLAEAGVLNNFDPTDCFSAIVGKEAGEYTLPAELAEIMTMLAMVKARTNVYTPWDNSIQLAARAARLGGAAYMETMREPTLAALVSMFVKGKIELAIGDPISAPSAVEGGKLRQFDTCMAFPPIGLRYKTEVVDRDWYGRFPEKTNSGSVLAVRHIMAQTRGRAVIGVPNSLLFSPGSDKNLREELLKRGLIEAVIAMPSGILTNTNISFALLILNIGEPRQTIRFVNAEDDRFREPISKARARLADIDGIAARAFGTLKDELVAEVPTAEVFANGTTLQVNRYVLPESSKKSEKLLASAATKTLGEVVTILRPMPTVPGDDTIRAWEVGAADIPEFAYIAQPTKEVGIDPAAAQRNNHQFLKPHDIVLIIKGSVGKVGIVPDNIPPPGERGWIVGQSAVILRVNAPEIISPKALAVYLRSPLGRKLLAGIAVKGATIPLIQQRELQRLQVVIPTKKEAAAIGKTLDEQADIQQEIEVLRARQAELAKQFWALD
jgi:type I restriction enzyme M protein